MDDPMNEYKFHLPYQVSEYYYPPYLMPQTLPAYE
ncbi:hypothetical protein EVA_13570 [gut metagenome]|uniref:Uncharacterized protein n=1 Tax=gut metagenome TaxID=749906 RepID=J9CEA2_9ZZZZ